MMFFEINAVQISCFLCCILKIVLQAMKYYNCFWTKMQIVASLGTRQVKKIIVFCWYSCIFFFQFSYIQNRCASSTCVMNGNCLALLQTLRRDNKLESIDRIIIGVKLWLIVCFKFLQLLSVKHVCNLQMYHPANILWKLCILASRCNISITQFMNIPETKGKKLSIFIRQLTS